MQAQAREAGAALQGVELCITKRSKGLEVDAAEVLQTLQGQKVEWQGRDLLLPNFERADAWE